MAKDKMVAKLADKPAVRVTASGSLLVTAEDIFNSRAGRDIIFRMTKIRPATVVREKTTSRKEKD